MSDTLAKTIAIGADHGGFALKKQLSKWLADNGFAVEDVGTYDGTTCDYPTIAAAVARLVSTGKCSRGIVIDGAGIGSSMAANKVPGVRAALCYDVSSARNSREHNDANVLTLGASLIGPGLAEQIVEVWLSTSCTVDRHLRRVRMINEIESQSDKPACGCHGSGESKHANSSDTRMSAASLDGLSHEDLARVAARIAELMGGNPFIGPCPCSCCGPNCAGRCAERDPATMRGLKDMGAGRIGHSLGGGPIAADVAALIDHTLLKPEATAAQVRQLCKEAMEFGFASVCINPSYVKLASSLLKGSSVAVCTVAGFPLGTHVPEIKALESRRAIRDGASEVDMVINIGALKGGEDDLVYRDIRAVVEACEDGRAICKVIIECALLTDDEKVRACKAARRARADFVKTSTGFASGGATAADVALMAEAVRGAGMGVKAAGGIRNLSDVKSMAAAGATRIGASAGVAIIKEAKGGAPPAAVTSTASKY